MLGASLLFFSLTLRGATTGTCHPGVLQLAKGDYAAALRSLSGSTSRDSSELGLLNNRGLAELMSGKLEQARQTFEAILARDPKFIDARFNLGILQLRSGDNDGALKQFRALAAEEGPLQARAAYHVALAEDRRGNIAAAEAALREGLRLDPALSEAKIYLGVVLEKQKKFIEAGESYRDYLADVPNDPTAMLRFGIVAWRAGYADTARRYLRVVAEQQRAREEALEARKYLLILE